MRLDDADIDVVSDHLLDEDELDSNVDGKLLERHLGFHVEPFCSGLIIGDVKSATVYRLFWKIQPGKKLGCVAEIARKTGCPVKDSILIRGSPILNF